MLDNHHGRFVHEIPQNVQRIIRIGQVCFPRMFSRLKQLYVRGQVLSRLNRFGLPENQVAVDHLVEGGFLSGIFPIAQSFLDIVNGPEHLFIAKRLPLVTLYKADLHLGRKMIIDNGTVHFLEIFGHGCLLFRLL